MIRLSFWCKQIQFRNSKNRNSIFWCISLLSAPVPPSILKQNFNEDQLKLMQSTDDTLSWSTFRIWHLWDVLYCAERKSASLKTSSVFQWPLCCSDHVYAYVCLCALTYWALILSIIVIFWGRVLLRIETSTVFTLKPMEKEGHVWFERVTLLGPCPVSLNDS